MVPADTYLLCVIHLDTCAVQPGAIKPVLCLTRMFRVAEAYETESAGLTIWLEQDFRIGYRQLQRLEVGCELLGG